MNINKNWHLANKMPKNPNLDQRVKWHVEDAKNCQCRPLGGKILILEEIKKRLKGEDRVNSVCRKRFSIYRQI